MPRNAGSAVAMGLAILVLSLATPAWADDQQVVEDYLKGRGISGAVIRPITDDVIGRAFPNLSFFGVVFRQFPVAVQCPQVEDLKCANVLYVRDGQVGILSSISALTFFFTAELAPAPTQDSAADAASAWLRLSGELKQDLFYQFSDPDITYTPRDDSALLRARVSVAAGGDGQIEVLMTFGLAGSLLNIQEKAAIRPGIRPICQATKLLDPDPVVRRMAEQDLLVMGRSAKTYLDHVRATASPRLRQAIDRLWQRILLEGR